MATIVLVSMVAAASAATPTPVGCTVCKAPAICYDGNNHEFLFVQGYNGNLWAKDTTGYIDGGHYAAWTNMGVAITSAPYAVSLGGQSIAVFFANSAGNIVSTTTLNDGATWSALTVWPGTVATCSGPAAVYNAATGETDVFYVASGSLNLKEDSLASTITPPSQAVSTNLHGVVTATPAAVVSGGVTDVVVRGTGGHIWERTYGTGEWSTWTPFHDGTIGYGAAMVNPSGTNVVLYVAGSDNRLYSLKSTDNGVSWQTQRSGLSWTPLNGVLTSQPSAALYTSGTPARVYTTVVVSGTDCNIWTWCSSTGLWNTPFGPVPEPTPTP
jgi:hypothetical protein